MDQLEYGLLERHGFKVIREHNNRIEIRTSRGVWSYLCDFSPEIWNRMLENDKTIKDDKL